MLTYRPEGLQSLPIPTPESLRRAGGSREIFHVLISSSPKADSSVPAFVSS